MGARFEEVVMKDHTVMPGEWFGGQLHVQAPSDIPADQTVWGIPARPAEEMKVFVAALQRLPLTRRRALSWLARLEALEARLALVSARRATR